MFRGKGDLGGLEELGTEGKEIPVEHGVLDQLHGGLLLARHEKQCEWLDENGEEGGEGRNSGNVRGEPVERFQDTGS